MICKKIKKIIIIIFFMSVINSTNGYSNYKMTIFDFKMIDINGKNIELSKYFLERNLDIRKVVDFTIFQKTGQSKWKI